MYRLGHELFRTDLIQIEQVFRIEQVLMVKILFQYERIGKTQLSIKYLSDIAIFKPKFRNLLFSRIFTHQDTMLTRTAS